MILKSVNITTLSLGGYLYIQLLKFPYPYVFHILLRGSGKTILSGTEMHVPYVKGIQCLRGKARLTKYCPAAPMVHGALHLRLGGGQSVGVLRWRRIRPASYACLPLQAGRWSLAGVGWISNFCARSPASAFSPAKIMSTQAFPRNVALKIQRRAIPLRRRFRPHRAPFPPVGPDRPLLVSRRGLGFPP